MKKYDAAQAREKGQTKAEMVAEVVRLARKGLDAEQIAERMNEQPIEQAWDVDVEQVRCIMDAQEVQS